MHHLLRQKRLAEVVRLDQAADVGVDPGDDVARSTTVANRPNHRIVLQNLAARQRARPWRCTSSCRSTSRNRTSTPTSNSLASWPGIPRFHVGDKSVMLGPGGLLQIQPDVMHWGEVGDEPVPNLDVFTPVREEYAPAPR